MISSPLLSVIPVALPAQALLQWPRWTTKSFGSQLPLSADTVSTPAAGTSESCRTSHVNRLDMLRGRKPAPFVTSEGPGWTWEQPAIPVMNSSAGEQWEFDGVSSDGSQAFMMGLYRDPNYSFLGTGNLRAYIELVFEDASGYAVVDYAEQSTVTTCPGKGAHGVWSGPGFIYEFDVSEDMSVARVNVVSAELNATIKMKSLSRPRYPDNTMWEEEVFQNADMAAVPHFYWVEPIPAAVVRVDVTRPGLRDTWTGVGGHERLWSAFNWRTCLRNLKIIRLQAGPFSLSLWEFGSSRIHSMTFTSVALFKDGDKIFEVAEKSYGDPALEIETVEQGRNRLTLRKLYNDDGITTQNLADKVTGVDLVLENHSRQLRWKFTVQFTKIAFEYMLTEARGGTGYAGVVTATTDQGNGDEHQWSGSAFVEIMRFPEGDWWLLPDNYVD